MDKWFTAGAVVKLPGRQSHLNPANLLKPPNLRKAGKQDKNKSPVLITTDTSLYQGQNRSTVHSIGSSSISEDG